MKSQILNLKSQNRIQKTFESLKAKGEKALITFVTAGDPDIETTKGIIHALERGGADIIELGIPFSDPMADGPTIQASSERALRNGVTVSDILDLVKMLRKRSEIPIILFGYYNPIFSYGVEQFSEDARDAGVDGLLMVDLPPEESDELKTYIDRLGLNLIFLLTPTSDGRRMRIVASKARGFIYYVSVTGVTGARDTLPVDVKEYVKRTRDFTSLPIGVGFGISTPEQAVAISRWADGIVVGSALVKIIERYKGSSELIEKVGGFVRGFKEAVRGLKIEN